MSAENMAPSDGSAHATRPFKPASAKHSPPPPIPIPHLLLDRSRLKPVPKPQPAPLQPPPAFHHLMPFRSKLRSTTAPVVPTSSSHPPPNPARSVSGSHINPNPNPEPAPAPPSTATTPTTTAAPDSDTASARQEQVQKQEQEQQPSIQDIPRETPAMADTIDHSAPPSLSSQSTSPDQSASSSPQDPAQPQFQDSADVDPPAQEPPPETHSQADHTQDQIQPWQNQFIHASSAVDHSSLERANSAAARLDSLARLNGVKIPDSSRRAHNLDVLPPFLMAKHIEETKKRVELGQAIMDPARLPHALPHANYPLPLPASLGFSVGPNGRGVPRLSALQRKALEKIANQQGSPDLSTAATSLTRSHTTTGTESPQHHTNRIQPFATDESHERQQARSNLIRKLSSRSAHPRPKLQIHSPPSTQLLATPQETVHDPPQRYTPELIPSVEQPPVRSVSKIDPSRSAQTSSPSHPPASPTSAAHSFDLNQVELSQLNAVTNFSLDSSLKPESEPVISSHEQAYIPDESIGRRVNESDMTSDAPDQCGPFALLPSPNLIDSHTHLDQPTQVEPENVDDTATRTTPITKSPTQHVSNDFHRTTTNADSSSGLAAQRSSPVEHGPKVAQLQPAISLSDCQSVLNSRSAELSDADVDARASGSHRLGHSPSSSTESGIPNQLLNPALGSSSARSSIVSRLKARASLSSRIDRSLASGRPTSPIQHNSSQSTVSHSSESQAERRRSSNIANLRVSRPSYPSAPQRIRNAAPDTSEEHTSKPPSGINRSGATSPSKPFHHGDRPLRPTRAPPITEAHNVVGRGLGQHRTSGDLGPSQFPPTPHLVRTHMPVASAVDLARYNDQKLAPFPGLLNNMTPPSSPERSRSPRSSSKTPKSVNHGILSSASNFFRSPVRRSREDSLSSEIRTAHTGLAKDVETLSASKYSMQMSHSNDEDEEEVVDSSRWQSMGDAAEKMSSPGPMSRASTGDSHHSAMSTISNQRREQILARLSPFLNPPSHSTQQNSKLHDPPRKLLWHQPVLQVANSASFKDRYLFVFNDILVITKPLLEFEVRDGERVPKLPITLEQSFLTKSVVELKDLRFMSASPHETPSSSQDVGPWFNEAFQMDPSQAVQSYLDSTHVQNPEYGIAKLLLSTHDLDKRQLGQYLAGPEHTNILRSYLEQLNFAFMRLEDALRAVLLSLRLPADPDAITRFLEQFGIAWTRCNPKVCLSATLATRWATAMIVLSEHLHDGLTDSMRYVAGLIGLSTKLKTEAQFVELIKADFDFTPGKENVALPADKLDAMLHKAYQSIRRDRLLQARANVEDTEKIQLSTEGGGLALPHQLTYQVESELITISIPQPDPQFGIKLFGPGLSFEPSFLSFSHSQEASFRIKGKAIGMRQISFIKIGRRAAAYEGLPLNSMVSVDRAFMRHTVQVGFYNHLAVKRKYLLSFHGLEPKQKFTKLITRAQNEARVKSSQTEITNNPQAMGKMVALQVLRDTLILNEDLVPINVNPFASTTVVLTAGNKKSKKEENQEGNSSNSNSKKSNRIRSNSLSETYIHTIGKNEKDFQDAIIERRNQAQEMHIRNKQKKLLKEQLKTNLEGGRLGLNPYSLSNKENPVGGADENQNSFLVDKFAKSGLHLIQHCEQNSLIPLVLGFLSIGALGKGLALVPNNTNTINISNNTTHIKSLNKFSSQRNLRGLIPINTTNSHSHKQENVDEDEDDEEEGNKTIRKQTSQQLDHRNVYRNHPSSSSIFARFSPK